LRYAFSSERQLLAPLLELSKKVSARRQPILIDLRPPRHSTKAYRKELGAPKLTGEAGYSVSNALGEAAFEVNGLLSGFTGEGRRPSFLLCRWRR